MKTEFIRNISHEIRTPLNIVSGFTQVLTSPDMDLTEEEKKDMQERMAENADRITKLVDRMLALSDACSETVIDRRDKTNVRDLASQAIGHSKITAHTRPGNSEATVTFEVEEMEPVTLCTSRLYAVRALAHLLENAVKFTPQGTIRLLAECTDRSVRFIVEDTGIGIPVSESDNIFGEFVQLDSFADGTGICLTVARSIARRMGGDLWLDTEYVKGARFVFELLRD